MTLDGWNDINQTNTEERLFISIFQKITAIVTVIPALLLSLVTGLEVSADVRRRWKLFGSKVKASYRKQNSEINLYYSDNMSISFNYYTQYKSDHQEGGTSEKSHFREQSRVTVLSVLYILGLWLFFCLFVCLRTIYTTRASFRIWVSLPPQWTRPCSDGPIC